MPKFSTKLSAGKIPIITMPKFPTKYYAVKSNFPGCGFITSHHLIIRVRIYFCNKHAPGCGFITGACSLWVRIYYTTGGVNKEWRNLIFSHILHTRSHIRTVCTKWCGKSKPFSFCTWFPTFLQKKTIFWKVLFSKISIRDRTCFLQKMNCFFVQ